MCKGPRHHMNDRYEFYCIYVRINWQSIEKRSGLQFTIHLICTHVLVIPYLLELSPISEIFIQGLTHLHFTLEEPRYRTRSRRWIWIFLSGQRKRIRSHWIPKKLWKKVKPDFINCATPFRERFTKDLGHPMLGSQQNFAHVTKSMLSWHVQNLIVIQMLKYQIQ